MSSLLYKIKNFGYRFGMRLFMPDLAREMKTEGLFDLPTDDVPTGDFIKVENNGADLTIFAFSGLDVLFAGLPRFEFQRVLRQLGKEANFVFMRDLNRLAFQLKPDGSPGGPEYWAEVILKLKNEIGATRNVAVGSSVGASAAFAFGVSAEMDDIILFGPLFKVEGFADPKVLWKSLFDGKKLFTEPRGYAESLIVSLAGRWGRKSLNKRLGEENVMDPLAWYEAASKKPFITVIYGETSWPDVSQAELLKGFPRTRHVALPTGRHNTPAYLKSRGELASQLAEALKQSS